MTYAPAENAARLEFQVAFFVSEAAELGEFDLDAYLQKRCPQYVNYLHRKK